jgi:deazaflavin-dependent oxidoreductase (nitroreductase family)
MMGLATTLNYGYRDRNVFHRAVARVVRLKPVSWLAFRLLPVIDPPTSRLTGGKSSFSQWMTGLPPIWVTAIGAKSGQPRTVALFGIPINDDIALVGTALGQPATPGWVYNIEADPNLSVSYSGATEQVVARPAKPEENAEVWATAASIYVGFAYYEDRVPHREVRIFILESGG